MFIPARDGISYGSPIIEIDFFDSFPRNSLKSKMYHFKPVEIHGNTLPRHSSVRASCQDIHHKVNTQQWVSILSEWLPLTIPAGDGISDDSNAWVTTVILFTFTIMVGGQSGQHFRAPSKNTTHILLWI